MNDTPENTLTRLEAAYARQVPGEYEKLFTADFEFAFSAITDPDMVSFWGTSWGLDDETITARNTFAFASSITLSGPAAAPPIADPDVPDSLEAYYRKVIVPEVSLTIEHAGGGEPWYALSPHNFYLVRGDRAELVASQEARVDRWYVYRWADMSTDPPHWPGATDAMRAMPASNASWGFLKMLFRNPLVPLTSAP